MKKPIRLGLLALLFLSFLSACESGNDEPPIQQPLSAGEWTWISGSDALNQEGIYGTQGIASTSNVPSARRYAASWLGSDGKLWLFGGEGPSSASYPTSWLNDLWKYDPTADEWTWISGSNLLNQIGIYGTKGSPSPSNIPGARRHAISWADSSGKLWLFGGEGYDSTGNWDYLNDLWKFDPIALEWTWISGSNLPDQPGNYGTKGVAAPSNVPGARYQSIYWIDANGKLWLFGGYGFATSGNYGLLNDLWNYNPITLAWTWVSGSNTPDQVAVYGTKGIATPTNIPGARKQAVSWIDSSGRLWLYGGVSMDATGGAGLVGDLWKYDPITHNWTWEAGIITGNQSAVYGTRGIAASSNTPGPRAEAISWIDASGKLWLFSGDISSATLINDLWMYDRTSLKWTWVSGSNTNSQSGTYGTKGIASSSNIPGARMGAVSWIDSQGRLWSFGGWGYASSAFSQGLLNDLWYHTR